jgi:predicted esterase
MPLLLLALLLQSPDIAEGKAKNGVTYCVRVPRSYVAKAGAPAILWLHGSNMNARDYVETFVSMKWFPDWIIVGVDGETGSKEKGHNYTFDSAKFIVEAYDEAVAKLKVSKAFVGGHSQGGYVTFSVVMDYPEKFAGAIPVAGGLWTQCEPDAFKPEVAEKQKKTAFAIVHGRADDVVDFELAESAHFSFVDAGFPMVRLWDPKEGDHRFALLPVKEAIEWCDAVTQTDAKKLAAAADRLAKERDWRGASWAASRGKASAVSKQVEAAAAPAAKALAPKMSKPGDGWVKEFWTFREQFGLTDAARPLMEAYAKLREAHQKPAEDLFWAARGDFQKGDKAAGYKKYEEIVAKYFGSKWYFYAKRGLDARK